MCHQWRFRSAWASAQSDQSLLCPHEESLGPKLPIERTAKTLIRLGGCPGWSESSLGAYAILLVCAGSNHFWPKEFDIFLYCPNTYIWILSYLACSKCKDVPKVTRVSILSSWYWIMDIRIDWLVDWLIDWLIDSLINWLSEIANYIILMSLLKYM